MRVPVTAGLDAGAHVIAEFMHGGQRVIIQESRNGYMSAWLIPKKPVAVTTHNRLPVSMPRTNSLAEAKRGAKKWVNLIKKKAGVRAGGAKRKKGAKKAKLPGRELTGWQPVVMRLLMAAHEDKLARGEYFGSKKDKAALRQLVKLGLARIVREDKGGPEGVELYACPTAAAVKGYETGRYQVKAKSSPRAPAKKGGKSLAARQASISKRDKERMYDLNLYRFNRAPPLTTTAWDRDAWIRYIDTSGQWDVEALGKTKPLAGRGGGPLLRRDNPGHNPGGAQDIELGDELKLYIDTSSEPIYLMINATAKNLINKMAAGKYDRAKARKAFMYPADAAAKEYVKEYTEPRGHLRRGPHGSFGPFSKATRDYVAGQLLADYDVRIGTGEYDHYLAQKYKDHRGQRLPWSGPPSETSGAKLHIVLRPALNPKANGGRK